MPFSLGRFFSRSEKKEKKTKHQGNFIVDIQRTYHYKSKEKHRNTAPQRSSVSPNFFFLRSAPASNQNRLHRLRAGVGRRPPIRSFSAPSSRWNTTPTAAIKRRVSWDCANDIIDDDAPWHEKEIEF